MKQRCFNPRNAYYDDYGGRGISVDPAWSKSFDVFFAYVGPRPPGTTLDRIDVNGHYQPGNVRWATPEVQANNTRRSRLLTHDGRTQSLSRWSREVGRSPLLIARRLERGWDVSRALTAPIKHMVSP